MQGKIDDMQTKERAMKMSSVQIENQLRLRLKAEARKRRMTLSGLLETIVESFLEEGLFAPKDLLACKVSNQATGGDR
jgi:hypothetical protein